MRLRYVGLQIFVLSLIGMLLFTVVVNASVDWNLLDFSGSSYASNGEGFTSFSLCNTMFDDGIRCQRNGLYDLKSVWVDQDTYYIGWKFTGNFTNSSFCRAGGQPLFIRVQLDSDGNMLTGCNGMCYPGSDYQITFNSTLVVSNYDTGSTSFLVNNSFNASNNATLRFNYTCGASTGDYAKFAVNKSLVKFKVLSFDMITLNTTSGMQSPIDALGKQGEDMIQFENSSGMTGGHDGEMFMYQSFGCPQYNGRQSSCENTTDSLSCLWDANFNFCNDNFLDATTYGCSKFCGACTNSTDCVNNPTCQWTGANFCAEDPTKFKFGGNCDANCYDCWTEFSCNLSSTAGGCSWITDPLTAK